MRNDQRVQIVVVGFVQQKDNHVLVSKVQISLFKIDCSSSRYGYQPL